MSTLSAYYHSNISNVAMLLKLAVSRVSDGLGGGATGFYYEFLERGQAGVRNQSTSHSMHCVKNA